MPRPGRKAIEVSDDLNEMVAEGAELEGISKEEFARLALEARLHDIRVTSLSAAKTDIALAWRRVDKLASRCRAMLKELEGYHKRDQDDRVEFSQFCDQLRQMLDRHEQRRAAYHADDIARTSYRELMRLHDAIGELADEKLAVAEGFGSVAEMHVAWDRESRLYAALRMPPPGSDTRLAALYPATPYRRWEQEVSTAHGHDGAVDNGASDVV